jgi:hypothetical protein
MPFAQDLGCFHKLRTTSYLSLLFVGGAVCCRSPYFLLIAGLVAKATFKVSSQVVTANFELFAFDADLAEHFIHGVFVIERLFLGATEICFLFCVVANGQAHNHVGSNLAGMKNAVEESEFHGTFGEEAM